MIQNEKKHKLTEIQKVKDTIHQLKKNKENMINDATKIEKDLPVLETQHKDLSEKKTQKE